MIEQEIIKQYPSLVARPYLLIKDDFQRKDMQRFWFENTISFLAVLSAAELVKFYKGLKSKEEKSEKDLEMIKALQEHKSLTMVGLEHMALGKWVMMLRETTKFLQELNAANTIPELVDFYHGKNGKNNAKLIDKFVSIRNDDAHGNPIPEEKLKAELDSRQKLIDSLLEELTFLKNYQLILPETLEIEGSSQFYICKQFVGNGIVNTKQTFEFSPQLSEVMLINQSKKDEKLSLNPLLLYLGIQDEENNFLGIFSKYSSKDGTEAKYLNLDGSGAIDLVNFGQDQEIDLIAERQSYSEIYSDPESFQVNLNVEMKFEEDSININTNSVFSLLIDNKKSADIEGARLILDIPKNISIDIEDVSKYQDLCSIDISNEQVIIEFDSIEDNQKIDPIEFSYTISEQGSYSLDGGRVLYGYYRTLADRESGQPTDEEIQFGGAVIEAQDPNSRDKMVPVINIKKGFIDEDGNPIQNVRIGEDFIFAIVVTNIGFSSAKNVLIDLVFPDHVNLKQGKETIKLGQLNPFESRTFKYVLNSHVPDIYTIVMQNVLYSDSHNTRYSTRCADDHFIIVRSDLVKEFVYNVKDHIDDLYIDEEEKKNIVTMVESLGEATNIDADQIYKEAETEAVIEIVRDLIEKTANKQELKIVEKIYEEGKRDSKITNSDPRKFLVFSSREMPFFAINLSKGYEPEFFALKTNINKRFDKVMVKQAVVKEGSYTLDQSIDFSEIKYSEKYGKDFFKQWLNIVLNRFSNDYILWKEIADTASSFYGINAKYISGAIAGGCSKREADVNWIDIILDRENNKYFYIKFDQKSTKNYKTLINPDDNPIKNLKFLKPTGSDKTRYFDAKNISFYLQVSENNKRTGIPAIYQNIKNSDAIPEILDSSEQLWNRLCLIHSLNLLDDELFSEQNYIEDLKEFTKKLFDKGFALRQNTKNNDMLDIYPLKYFKPHTATERDCIGFIKKNYSSWQIFLDFFEDNLDDETAQYLSLITSNSVSNKVRWIKSDIQDLEQFNVITKAILTQTETYKINSLAIWPEKLQREMILNHGQADTGFFIILKNLLSGKNSYEEILKEFKLMHLDKELDRTLQRSELFEMDAGYESPFYIEGTEDNKTISYKPYLEDTLKEMFSENPKFTYLEEGSALFRIYTRQISQGHELLSNRSPANSGYVDFTIKKINSKYFNTCWIGLNPLKGQKIEFYNVFNDCKQEGDEKIKEKYSSLNQKFDNALSIDRSGRKDQHVKVSYIYEFTDFDGELGKMKEICHEFIVESINIAESFGEES